MKDIYDDDYDTGMEKADHVNMAFVFTFIHQKVALGHTLS
jgi:hypothetical protein